MPARSHRTHLCNERQARGRASAPPDGEEGRGVTFRWIMRLDTVQRIYRVARFTWSRGIVGNGKGYSAKLTFALTTEWFPYWTNEFHDWFFVLFGLRIHYCRSYGGRFAA
jgi:hypothetical protein